MGNNKRREASRDNMRRIPANKEKPAPIDRFSASKIKRM